LNVRPPILRNSLKVAAINAIEDFRELGRIGAVYHYRGCQPDNPASDNLSPMYTILRHPGTRRLLLTEAPSAAIAMAAAEWFYRFHSFTLECLAFLATWCALSALGFVLNPIVRKRLRA
jgi:hypothetical protein